MKYLPLLIIVIVSIGCERTSNETSPKPPFTNIDECIDYVNKSDAKKGYPKRKKDSVISECKNNYNLMKK